MYAVLDRKDDLGLKFKAVKPEVNISVEGFKNAADLVKILTKQGYACVVYLDDEDMDIYEIKANYIGGDAYEMGIGVAFVSTEDDENPVKNDYQKGYHEGYQDGYRDALPAVADEDDGEDDDLDDVFPDDAEQFDEDEGENYYDLGYADGKYDCKNGKKYNDGRYNNDNYACGYADGWDEAEDEEADVDDEDDVEETDGWMSIR